MQCARSELDDLRKKTIDKLYLINLSFESLILNKYLNMVYSTDQK
jgi:hypothetical protein